MAQGYPKRLIEVDLPIRRISVQARREKSIRHGHISTLHVWWARRPLAACRAVLCAALWPDPADELCPDAFRQTARKLMSDWASRHLELSSPESFADFVAIQKNPEKLANDRVLRGALLNFVADFANWDNAAVREYLATSRALTAAAHEGLGGMQGSRPLVVDSFAGGGSIPLEALRVGADAFASELNPVPVLINKMVLECIPKYGPHLDAEIRKWGKWIKREAKKELAEFYPQDRDGATPIAYVWARTVISEAPTGNELPVQIPLLRSLWLSKRKGNLRALRWLRDRSGVVVTEVADGFVGCKTGKVQIPLLEVFSPAEVNEVEAGTAKAGTATCPVSGFTMRATQVKEQLKEQRGGADHSRLCAVYVDGANGREFRASTVKDLNAFRAALVGKDRILLKNPDAFPTEPINPIRPFKNTRGLSAVTRIGCEQFVELYNSRQALSIYTFYKALQRLRRDNEFCSDAGFADAIEIALAFAIDRAVSQNTSMSRWDASRLTIKGAFGCRVGFCRGEPFLWRQFKLGWSNRMGVRVH
jgi:putative DNA methylase